ncbi:HNH endonuclease [Pseudomonas sp. NIBR-H-19]|uniref:HNH endonuclease n=1 Tax=Pseudomonas sp. NIBR-H-19 TaxID=2901380 RepID=UPI001E4AFDAE|nr:HNH endonuclease signature motif containing protein [Pseudomonas sp. NIBR-H-19]UHC84878.1 HNH endonuclease [Pseudomonas sp. NIBR-H-19]
MATNSPWHHLYKTKRWYRLRWHQLQAEPTCRFCRALGTVTAADTVDHIKPHKGDEVLFFDGGNLQSLCASCHNSVKQRQEKSGYLVGHDTSGMPVDPNHHWNR